MCGFAGYIDLRNERRVDKDVLTRMTQALIHRGPDSSGFFIHEDIGLGFRRLKIIDPEGGDQPLFNEDDSVALVCNGEIFNYRELKARLSQSQHVFKTRTDVEVLLHLYEEEGVELLNMLNGQFAFALYDKRENKLFLARDHLGINPLYYTVRQGVFIFASEIKAILQHPLVDREVDLTGLDQILTFPGLISPRTMFRDIASLESGHYMIVDSSSYVTREYWDLDYPAVEEISNDRPESFYVNRLRDLLCESVRYRLHADVPVGYYLSGGLDSSLIAAMIYRASPDVGRHSFSISFSDKGMSEAQYQTMMAGHVGSVHHDIIFTSAEIARRLPDAVFHSECPLKETYNTASLALSETARYAGIPVVLNGEGADELFAGYVGYRVDRFKQGATTRSDLETAIEEELRDRIWGDRSLCYEKDLSDFREIRTALYSSTLNSLFDDFDCLNYGVVNKERLKDRHFVHKRSYLDVKLRLSGHLIADHGDRMAMANSVEARYPYLDRDLIAFATEIPPDLKLSKFTEKYILKRVAAGYIPQEIIEREKRPFFTYGSPELLANDDEQVKDMLSYERIKRQGYFNPDAIERLKAQYSQKGFKLNLPLEDDLLMVVLTFGLFLEAFGLADIG